MELCACKCVVCECYLMMLSVTKVSNMSVENSWMNLGKPKNLEKTCSSDFHPPQIPLGLNWD